ncbi:MAG: hypothetical protein ABJA76_09335 [Mucilaginibacter sp.]
MANFFNPASLTRVFELKAPIQAVTGHISRTTPTGFSVTRLSNFEFIFLSDLSLGTLIKNGKPPAVNGIQTRVVLTQVGKNTAVTFTTKRRFELILTLGAWVLITLFQVVGKQAIPIWVTAAFFPGVLIFFFLLYRIQENVLQSKAEAYLKQL